MNKVNMLGGGERICPLPQDFLKNLIPQGRDFLFNKDFRSPFVGLDSIIISAVLNCLWWFAS
jgi:hypothetical protein